MGQPSVSPPMPPGSPAVWTPSPGMLDHPILFDENAAHTAVRAAAKNRTWRIVSLFISAGISAAIWWFFREHLGDFTGMWIAVAMALPVVFLVVAIVQEVVVRREVRRVGQGLALGVGRRGLFLRGVEVPWSDVGAVTVRSGRLGARGTLRVRTQGGQKLELPLGYLAASPAAIDSAVFALSGGRVRVDFSALDV